MAKLPIHLAVDVHALDRCKTCMRKHTELHRMELTRDSVLLLHTLQLLGKFDNGFMNPHDVTATSGNKAYGLLQSRKTGKDYEAPIPGARTHMRKLLAAGLVDHIPNNPKKSGYRINGAGISFLNGDIRVPRVSWEVDGGTVKQDKRTAVTIKWYGIDFGTITEVHPYDG